MQGALTNLGVDYKLLIAQLVNFLLLFVVLYIFLYKPVLKVLNARAKKVGDSLSAAEEIEKRLLQVEQDVKAKLAEADKQANVFISEATQQSKEIETTMANEAQAKANQIIEKAKVEIATQQQKMMAEAKTEIANLVSETIRLIAEDKTLKLDTKLIDGTISKIKQGVADGQ